MALQTFEVLSLWEIAHRWHNEDPNTTDPQRLSLGVQDTLRQLTRAAYDHKLTLCTERGHEIGNRTHYEFLGDPMENEDDRDRYNKDYYAWLEYLDKKTAGHDAIVKEFVSCFNNREHNKAKLDAAFTSRFFIADFCVNEQLPAPQFWFTPEEITKIGKGKNPLKEYDFERPTGNDDEPEDHEDIDQDKFSGRHGQSKLDRELCRAIAATLWLEHPEMTISDIVKHRSILIYGNGKQYTGRETIKNWVKDLDPRPTDKKLGRPRKKKEVE